MTSPDAVRRFWLEEVKPEQWYIVDESLDRAITERFGFLWESALSGDFKDWLASAEDSLSYIILTDQFPRNMFRGAAEAFSTDSLAREATRISLERGWDLRVEPPGRQFFYLPLMHSEDLRDQERSVEMFRERMEDTENLIHALAHLDEIRCFGRFPSRNAALNRDSTAEEKTYLDSGGYGATLEAIMQNPKAKDFRKVLYKKFDDAAKNKEKIICIIAKELYDETAECIFSPDFIVDPRRRAMPNCCSVMRQEWGLEVGDKEGAPPPPSRQSPSLHLCYRIPRRKKYSI